MKTTIRRQALRARLNLTAEEVKGKSQKIARRLFSLPEFKRARTIMFYVSRPEEVDTHQMIRSTLRAGYRVAVPLTGVKGEKIVPVLIDDLDRELSRGQWGILEPNSPERAIPPREIDLVVLPGVAFDCRGNRVGRGLAFYDDFLVKVPPQAGRIALAFEEQVYREVPSCGHDIPVTKVVTEKRVIDCRVEAQTRGPVRVNASSPAKNVKR